LIVDKDIESLIRLCATQVYGVKDPKELALFSSHSIRVGACVFLHMQGKDALFIKHRLRWESDTYMVYLRNMSLLADQHTALTLP